MKFFLILLFPLLFVCPLFSQTKTMYLSCDTLSLSKDFIEVQIFQKNERVIGLEIDRSKDRVVWDGDEFDFIDDYNKDNIYELKTEKGSFRIEIDFNRVTGRLDETIIFMKKNRDIINLYEYEYQCTRSEPLFER